MVSPDNEPQESDGHYGSDHAHITERFFFAGVVGHNVGNHAKPGKNKNIDFGVAKESEQVLIKDWVSSTCGVEEGCVKVTIGE